MLLICNCPIISNRTRKRNDVFVRNFSPHNPRICDSGEALRKHTVVQRSKQSVKIKYQGYIKVPIAAS